MSTPIQGYDPISHTYVDIHCDRFGNVFMTGTEGASASTIIPIGATGKQLISAAPGYAGSISSAGAVQAAVTAYDAATVAAAVAGRQIASGAPPLTMNIPTSQGLVVDVGAVATTANIIVTWT